MHWGGQAAAVKLFLILDALCARHRKPVKIWIDSRKGKIACRTKTKPDDRLDAHLLSAPYTWIARRTKVKLKPAVAGSMQSLENPLERMRALHQTAREKKQHESRINQGGSIAAQVFFYLAMAEARSSHGLNSNSRRSRWTTRLMT